MSSERRSELPRRPHYWRVRNDGYRELAASKGWAFCGGYASKTIGGQTIMMRTHEVYDDWSVKIIERKIDHWHRIRTNYRYKLNRRDRARRRRVWHAYNWHGQYTTAPTKRDLRKNIQRHVQELMGRSSPSLTEEKISAGAYRLIIDDQPWFLFRYKSAAENAGFTIENYRAFEFLHTDLYERRPHNQDTDTSISPIPLWFQGETGRKRLEYGGGCPEYALGYQS